ncbi:MAG: hypothetical protein L3J54_01195 [Draconibacterium sp.]|nr:hypothetical protein [Draconibacterium sp.]
MEKKSELHYIEHKNIDSEKWNRCIDNSANCRIYSYDWHLDRTAIIWDAFVWGDYEFIMPLPFRKKMGVKYLFQPLFSQQLGIFPNPPAKIKEQFYSALLKKFSYSDFQINSENSAVSVEKEIEFTARDNFLLPLDQDYSQLSKSFSKNTKRNLTKANKNSLSLVQGVGLEEYLEFKRENLVAGLSKKEFASLKSLIAFGQYKGFGEIYGVYTPENKLCAAVYFCRWKERVIYMNAASNEQGRELGGMYFLVDSFIRNHANNNITLDFEGSMIPGVARFYHGFGAAPETYFQLKFNRLPLPFKWLKR